MRETRADEAVPGKNRIMATHVALLRGINLSGKSKVALADRRTLVGGLGQADVSTYIQSGNGLFTASEGADCAAVSRAMAKAIASDPGVTSPVVAVTRDELAEIAAANPYPGEPDPRRVHAVVLREPPDADLTVKLEAAAARAPAPWPGTRP